MPEELEDELDTIDAFVALGGEPDKSAGLVCGLGASAVQMWGLWVEGYGGGSCGWAWTFLV